MRLARTPLSPDVSSNAVILGRPGYRLPLALDFRVGPRMPLQWIYGTLIWPGGWRDQTWVRTWGRLPRMQLISFADVDAHRTSKRVTPPSSAERVQWYQPFRCIDLAPLDVGPNPRTWELVRVRVSEAGTGILERVATYLRAAWTVGDPEVFEAKYDFTTSSQTDPCAVITDGQAVLRFEWSIRLDGIWPERSQPEPLMLVGASPQFVPQPMIPIPGVPTDWRDLRYAYGGRYTDFHRVVLEGHSLLRLFVTLHVANAVVNPFTVTVGGLLGGFWQSAGPLGSAQTAATRRF